MVNSGQIGHQNQEYDQYYIGSEGENAPLDYWILLFESIIIQLL